MRIRIRIHTVPAKVFGWLGPGTSFRQTKWSPLDHCPALCLDKSSSFVVESIKIPCEAVGRCLNSKRFCILSAFRCFFVPGGRGVGGGGREGGSLVKTDEETAKSFLEL